MKKLVFVLSLLVTFNFLHSQVKIIGKLPYDTVKVGGPKGLSGNYDAVLQILNGTKDTTGGFLYNSGNGITSFKKPLKKINDSTYLVGIDTLKIKSQGGGSSYSAGNGINLTGSTFSLGNYTNNISLDGGGFNFNLLNINQYNIGAGSNILLASDSRVSLLAGFNTNIIAHYNYISMIAPDSIVIADRNINERLYINTKNITLSNIKNNSTLDSALIVDVNGNVMQKKFGTSDFYSIDGTIASNRTVNGNAKSLSFSNLSTFNLNATQNGSNTVVIQNVPFSTILGGFKADNTGAWLYAGATTYNAANYINIGSTNIELKSIDKLFLKVDNYSAHTQTSVLTLIDSLTGEVGWREPVGSGSSSGEANTISSVGSGFSIVKGKVGVDLQIKSVFVDNNTMLLNSTTNDFTLGVDTSKIVTNSHLASYALQNSRTLSVNGVSYDLSANRSWTVDLQSALDAGRVYTANSDDVTPKRFMVFKNTNIDEGYTDSLRILANTGDGLVLQTFGSDGTMTAQINAEGDHRLSGLFLFDRSNTAHGNVISTAATTGRTFILPDANGTALVDGNLSTYVIAGINGASGTINDARLSSNVALKNGNNAMTGSNTFSGTTNTFSAAVNMTGNTTINNSNSTFIGKKVTADSAKLVMGMNIGGSGNTNGGRTDISWYSTANLLVAKLIQQNDAEFDLATYDVTSGNLAGNFNINMNGEIEYNAQGDPDHTFPASGGVRHRFYINQIPFMNINNNGKMTVGYDARDVAKAALNVKGNFAVDTLLTGSSSDSVIVVNNGILKRVLQSSIGAGGTVASVSGTSNRITSTGGTTPVIDISSSYVGQSSITTLGTIATGTWQGSSIATTFTDAKIKTVTGTSNRISIGGTSTDPTFDISSSYVGQASITTLGTITTGTWHGSAIDLSTYASGNLPLANVKWSMVTAVGTSNYTVSGNDYINLSDLTGQANRTVTLPSSPTTGQFLILKNKNKDASGFTWTTNVNLRDGDGNAITTLANSTVYWLTYNGTDWDIDN